MDLPSNIFCHFPNCKSPYIVHKRASDILEAGSSKKGSKRSNADPSRTIDHNDTDELIPLGSDKEGTSTCCSPITRHKHSPAKDHKHESHNYNNRIMKEPVILPCGHGYCHECVVNLTSVCHACGREFSYKDSKPNKFLQQICDWFGENRTFISLLIGQDITQPSQSIRAKLTRSASTDISTRGRTFLSGTLTRSSSTDSIGSIAEEEEEELIVNSREKKNGNTTRLAKLQVGLKLKPEEPAAPAKARGFSILLPKSNNKLSSVSDSGSSKLSSSPTSSSNFLFRKLRSRKDSISSGSLPLPPIAMPITEEVLFKNKSESKVVDVRRETTAEALGVIGVHKRTQSSVQPNERIAGHKSKSKSFTTPSILIPSSNGIKSPSPLMLTPLSTPGGSSSPTSSPSTPKSSSSPSLPSTSTPKSSSSPSLPPTFTPKSSSSPSLPSFTPTPNGLTPSGSSKVLSSVSAFSSSPGTRLSVPPSTPAPSHHVSPPGPSTPTSTLINHSSPLHMAVSATTFACMATGAHPTTPNGSTTNLPSMLSPLSKRSSTPKNASLEIIPEVEPAKASPSMSDLPAMASLPSSINHPMDPINNSKNQHVKFSKIAKLSSSSMLPRSSLTHPLPAFKVATDDVIEEIVDNSGQNNSSNARAIRFSIPSPPPTDISTVSIYHY